MTLSVNPKRRRDISVDGTPLTLARKQEEPVGTPLSPLARLRPRQRVRLSRHLGSRRRFSARLPSRSPSGHGRVDISGYQKGCEHTIRPINRPSY
jgi:hypothetical protein